MRDLYFNPQDWENWDSLPGARFGDLLFFWSWRLKYKSFCKGSNFDFLDFDFWWRLEKAQAIGRSLTEVRTCLTCPEHGTGQNESTFRQFDMSTSPIWSASLDRSQIVWKLTRDDKQHGVFTDTDTFVSDVVLSPDGRILCLVRDENLRSRDLSGGRFWAWPFPLTILDFRNFLGTIGCFLR